MLTSHPPPGDGSGGGGDRPPPPGDGSGGGGGGGGGESLGTAAGIGLSGGYIFNALAGGNVDAVENEGMTLDTCLSHPTPMSEFHYHFWSGCIVKNKGFWSDSAAPALCKDTEKCQTKPAELTMGPGTNGQASHYIAANWDKPIGLARDGHLIIGPYK